MRFDKHALKCVIFSQLIYKMFSMLVNELFFFKECIKVYLNE